MNFLIRKVKSFPTTRHKKQNENEEKDSEKHYITKLTTRQNARFQFVELITDEKNANKLMKYIINPYASLGDLDETDLYVIKCMDNIIPLLDKPVKRNATVQEIDHLI